MNKSILLVTCVFCLIFIEGFGQRARKKENGEQHTSAIPKELKGIGFRSLGPAITSGRISDILVHPVNHDIIYVASSSGGIWKTINHGTTWEPIFDKYGSFSIGCLAMDPRNSNIIYAGTGENNNQRSVAYGDGVYQSKDGGVSWNLIGLEKSEHISKIIVDPTNSNKIYVAAYGPLWSPGGERGIYASEDMGKSWKQLLAVDEHTGFSDLIMDPLDHNVLYAAAHQRRRHVFTYISGGPGSAIYRTIDGGGTWEKLKNGLPSGDVGRIGLAMHPNNPDLVYAIIEGDEKEGGFYKSTTRGANWEKMGKYFSAGNYYSEIYVDPNDENTIYSMDTWLKWSKDGGKTFSSVNEKWKHVDNHAIWIDPGNSGHFLVGCDGGLYETYDGAQNWYFYSNLPIVQFYKVCTDNDFPFYNVYGGTQDNFSMGGPSRTINEHGISNHDWFITNGGDGFESAVDPENPSIVYSQSQYGGLVRYDKASGERIFIQPIEKFDEEPYRWNWDAPLIISHHDHKRLYFAANKVFRSKDMGEEWEVISPDLTMQIDRNSIPVMGKIWPPEAIAKNSSTSIYGNITSLSESSVNENILVAGTDDGLVKVTNDGGESWSKAAQAPGVPGQTYVNAVWASQHDQNRLYAVYNNHKNGDFKPYLYMSGDLGKSWVKITGNLPEKGSVYSFAEDHKNGNLLFVGTEYGMFFSYNLGKSWTQMKKGLPTIAIRDMDIQKREDALVLASFGRGFYVLDNYALLREFSDSLYNQEFHLFATKDAWMYIPSSPLGLRGNSFRGASFYSTPNPQVATTFTYYLKDALKSKKETRLGDKEMKMYPAKEELVMEELEPGPFLLFTISDMDGNAIRRLKTKGEQGFNQVSWDFRMAPSVPISLKGQNLDNPFVSPDLGPFVVPGTYMLSVSKFQDGQFTTLESDHQFEVKSLNMATMASQDKAALLKFQYKVAEVQRVVLGLEAVFDYEKEKLDFIKKAVENAPSVNRNILVEIFQLEKEMDELGGQIKGDRRLMEMNYPVNTSLISKIGILVENVMNATSAPSVSMNEMLEGAIVQFEKVRGTFITLKNGKIKSIENILEQNNAPHTPGRIPELKLD